MSKIVLICYRNPPPEQTVRRRLERLLSDLRPDNLATPAIRIESDGRGLYLGVLNPATPAPIEGCSAYAGWLADSRESWWKNGAPAPDGTYALFRGGHRFVEALTDCTASRTIWIAKTDEIFIAATSQRALPAFLGRFELNPRAALWMLSSGSLGPGESWDRRAKPLAPGGRASLDRELWRLKIEEPTIEFRASQVHDRLHLERLRAALAEVCGALHLDWSRWVLPLSGGVDSRAILLNLRDRRGLRCITWGLQQALEIPGSDAQVAGELAQWFDLPRQYFATDPASEPADKVLERFLTAGEGRVDHIGGYMDGLRLWSELASTGVTGVVRGEEPWSPTLVATDADVRPALAMTRWSDNRGLPTLAELDLTHLGDQPLPPALERRPAETTADWRDRLLQAFRIPTVSASLNDLKSAYVEIATPLLTRRIVELARSEPVHLRMGRRILLEHNRSWNLPLPYATSRAIASTSDALAAPQIRELLLDELASARCQALFSARFTRFLANGLHAPGAAVRPRRRTGHLKHALRRWFPARVQAAWSRRAGRPPPSAAQLALRAWLTVRMASRLDADAREAV